MENKFRIILIRGNEEIEVEVPDRSRATQHKVLKETGANHIKMIEMIEELPLKLEPGTLVIHKGTGDQFKVRRTPEGKEDKGILMEGFIGTKNYSTGNNYRTEVVKLVDHKTFKKEYIIGEEEAINFQHADELRLENKVKTIKEVHKIETRRQVTDLIIHFKRIKDLGQTDETNRDLDLNIKACEIILEELRNKSLEDQVKEISNKLPGLDPKGNKFYTVNEVARELEITPQQLRKHLRKINHPKLSNGKYGLTKDQLKHLKLQLNK